MLLHFKSILFLIGILYTTQLLAQCPNSYNINTIQEPYCNSSISGELSLTQTTFYSSSSYLWSNGATTRSINNIPIGFYSVTVTDPTGCSYSDTTYLANSPDGIPITAGYFGGCLLDGILGVSTPQSPLITYPLQYNWSNGETTNYFEDAIAGTYSVTVTDAAGCVGQTTVIQDPYYAAPIVSNTITPAGCSNTGAIDMTLTGSISSRYVYQWWDDLGNIISTNLDLTNVSAGNYTLKMAGIRNCVYNRSHNFTIPGAYIEQEIGDVSCGNLGFINLAPIGITTPSYSWSNGATTANISGLSAGNYTVTVAGSNCTKVKNYTIGTINQIYAYISNADSLAPCPGKEIYVNANAGFDQRLTYLWNDGSTTNAIITSPNIPIYNVTISNNNGCSRVLSRNNNNNSSPVSAVVTDATCGNSDGAIDVSSFHPAYRWSPTGATTQDITGIAAGFHIVTSYGYDGCSRRDTFAVGEFIETTSINASCGLNNGSATVVDYNMNNPSYSWSNGTTSNVAANLSAGTYFVTVTSSTCTVLDTIIIDDTGFLQSSIRFDDACQPQLATAIPTGGAAPYSFSWSTGNNMQSIRGINRGSSYTVTITDANGCTHDTTVVAPSNPIMNVTTSVVDATCNSKNGEIRLQVTGGTPPFNYRWSNFPAYIPTLVGIYAGQYAAVVTDNNGCKTTISPINVGGATGAGISRRITPLNSTNTGGAIDLSTVGLTTPTYLWNTGATTQNISGLSSGMYGVTVTDLPTGCVFNETFNLHNVTNPGSGNTGGTGTHGPRPYYISGQVLDVTSTNNCTPTNSLPIANRLVRLMPGNLIQMTDNNGGYTFTVGTNGTYTVELVNNRLNTIYLCPSSRVISVMTTAQRMIGNNFFVTNPPAPDLWIDLEEYSPASPGFPYYTRIKYCNHGNVVMTGNVSYDYNALLGFQSITNTTGSFLASHNIAGQNFNWSFANLQPTECRNMDVKFRVPATTALGTTLQGNADVLPVIGDATPNNNSDQIGTTVVGSWDPNDKQVSPYHTGNAWEGGTIYQADEELEYMIRFQNTGTAPAQFVIIRDTLDVNLIPSTIRYIDTKHDADIRIEDGNILIATFDNIYLPDSSVDFEASIGFIKFTINRQPNLPIGTSIENTAAIYFDFNAPIITNTPVSTIGTITSHLIIADNQIDIQTLPNPFQEQITVQYQLEQEENITIQIHNSLGQVVKTYTKDQTQQAGAHIETINTQSLPSAMYLLVLSTDDKIITKRIIKQ